MSRRRKVISRADAKRRGLTRYFTGRPCKRGHVCERRVYNWECLECYQAVVRRWQRRPRGRALRAQTVARYQKTPKGQRAVRRYRESPKGLEKRRERDRRYRNNPKNRDLIRARWRRWYHKRKRQRKY